MKQLMCLLAFVTAFESAPAQKNSVPPCSLSLGAPLPVTLHDGRALAVDARSAVVSGDRVLVIGNFGFAFSNPENLSTRTKPLLGFIRVSDGSFAGVSVPRLRFNSDTASNPHAVADGNGGWHVLYIERQWSQIGTAARALDSSLIWYAHYDGLSWTNSRVVASVSNAGLSHNSVSGLAFVHQQIFFAFDFSEPFVTTGVSKQGVIMLWFSPLIAGARPVLDTIMHFESPRFVQTLNSPDGLGALVFMTQSYISRGRLWPSAIFEAAYITSWGVPRLLVGDSIRGVTQPFVNAVEGHLLVSYELGKERNLSDLFAADRAISGLSATSSSIGEINDWEGYAVLPLMERGVVWMMKSGVQRGNMQFYLQNSGTPVDLGTHALPFDNPSPVAFQIDRSTFYIITERLGKHVDEPIVNTILTQAVLICP